MENKLTCTKRKYRANRNRTFIVHMHGNVLDAGYSFVVTDKKGLLLYSSSDEKKYSFNEAIQAAKSLIDFKHGYLKSEYTEMLLKGDSICKLSFRKRV